MINRGIVHQKTASHYRVGMSEPVLHVIIEVASDEMWKVDLEEKPVRYGHMGVQEYSPMIHMNRYCQKVATGGCLAVNLIEAAAFRWIALESQPGYLAGA